MSLEKAEQYLEHKGMLDRVIRLKESTATVACLLYTSPSPRDYAASRMPSSA